MQNYIDTLNKSSEVTMRKIIEIAMAFTPNAYRGQAWRYPSLAHGKAILNEENAFNCYLTAYGIIHVTKLEAALNRLPAISYCQEYEIIDWGCGQGLATICFLDMLEKKNIKSLPSNITFIDASEMALERAVLHTNAKLHSSNTAIKCVHAELGCDFYKHNYIKASSRVTIHLLSNIIDIYGVSANAIANTIMSSSAVNYIVCAGHGKTSDYANAFCKNFRKSNLEIIYNWCKEKEWRLNNGHYFGGDLRVLKYVDSCDCMKIAA